ncbi:hypothetical protein NL676_029626 [Syzygium grande]|nr:hypothetical protein NL676_029626 [Syzygium grande]
MASRGDRDHSGHHQPELRGRKRKAEPEPGPIGPCTSLRFPAKWEALLEPVVTEADHAKLVRFVIKMVGVLDRTFSCREDDRIAAQNAILILTALAEKGKCVDEMVQNGAIPALVKHLQAPPSGKGDKCAKFFQHKVETTSAYALRWLAAKPEHGELIIKNGALTHLLNLLKRYEAGSSSQSVNDLILRAIEAISKLAQHNSSAAILVRMEGGIPLLVELLDAYEIHLQGAAAAALCMLALESKENRNQVALISVLVRSSRKIKKDVLAAGALQPIIRLLSSSCVWSQMEAARLVGLFAAANSIRKNSDTQVGIAHEGGLLALLELVDSESESLQDVAACALHTLLNNEENVSEFITIGGFQKLQRGEFTGHEKDATSIEIPNIRWEIFELMLRFMYSESVEVTPDNAQELLKAADQYLIEGLKQLCERAIGQELSMETISTIYELSNDFHATSLKHSCILFILEHFDEFRHRYSQLIQEIVPAIRDYFSEALTK